MKLRLFVLCTVSIAFVSAAQTFFDDFNRKSTPFVERGKTGAIGEGWESSSSGSWRILDEKVIARTPAEQPKPVLYNKKIVTDSGFKLSAVVTLNTDQRTGLAGIMSHFQNDTDHYIFRFSGIGTVQFMRKNSASLIMDRQAAFTQKPRTPYRLTMVWKVPNSFDLRIEDTETGKTVFSETVTDSQRSYSTGFGGVYCSVLGTATFDDVSYEKLK